jgi:hypothetical protein
MPINPLTARRVALAGAFAFALTVAAAPHALADSTADGCTAGESMDAYSLACVPDIVPNVQSGAPSEMQVTQDNPGMASPESHGGR